MPNQFQWAGELARAWRWWTVAVAVIMFDQVTKFWAEAALSYNEPWAINSLLNFTLRYNPGAAFSFLAGEGGWQRWFFTGIASVVSVFLVAWITRLNRDKGKWLEALALSLILGGAIGNLYDRVVLGHVVDFIEVHYQQYYWPAFNIADSAICIGAGLLILDMLTGKKDHHD